MRMTTGRNTMLYLNAPIVIEENTMTRIAWPKREKNKKKPKKNQQVNVLHHIKEEAEVQPEIVAAVRQRKDGEPLTKQANLRRDRYHRKMMRTEFLVGYESRNKNNVGSRSSKKKK